jgi:hypothetical protein
MFGLDLTIPYSNYAERFYSKILISKFSEITEKTEKYCQSFFNDSIYKKLENTILTQEQYHQFLIDQHKICLALEKIMLKCINENPRFLKAYKYKKTYDLEKDLTYLDSLEKKICFFQRKVSKAALNYIKYLECLNGHEKTQKSIGNYYAKFIIDLNMNQTFKEKLDKKFPRNFLTFENEVEKEIELFNKRFLKISIDICNKPFIKGSKEAFEYLKNVFQATLDAK